MKILRGYKKRKVVVRDSQKESLYRELSELLTHAGFHVRREKLKQGHGWRVASGRCRADLKNYVFVDRRLSQDEQLSFLVSKAVELGVPVGAELVERLPRQYQAFFTA